jgi:hypothetical protein
MSRAGLAAGAAQMCWIHVSILIRICFFGYAWKRTQVVYAAYLYPIRCPPPPWRIRVTQELTRQTETLLQLKDIHNL